MTDDTTTRHDDVMEWKTFHVTAHLCGEFIGHSFLFEIFTLKIVVKGTDFNPFQATPYNDLRNLDTFLNVSTWLIHCRW